jgi:hypothetical protein
VAVDHDTILLLAEELVGSIGAENRRRGLLRADFPLLASDSFQQRMTSVITGRGKGRVNFPAVLKKTLASTLPQFTLRGMRGDYHIFERALADDFRLLLLFEKVHQFGFGKTYNVHLGVEQRGAPVVAHALTYFFDRTFLDWAYGTQDELQACLNETHTLLGLVLPAYEAAWRALLDTGESAVLHGLEERGALSFHEALRMATDALQQAAPRHVTMTGAWLRPAWSGTVKFEMPLLEAADATGRLRQDQCWQIRLEDSEAPGSIVVHVPRRGRLQYRLWSQSSVKRNNVFHRLRAPVRPGEGLTLPAAVPAQTSAAAHLPTPFADSTTIMALTEAAGGAAFRAQHPGCAVRLQLQAERTEPPAEAETWWVDHLVPGSRARLGFILSARTGLVLQHYSEEAV